MVRFTRRRNYRNKSRSRKVASRRVLRRQRGGALEEDLEALLLNYAQLAHVRAYIAEHHINCIHAKTPVRGEDSYNIILVKEVHGANDDDVVPMVVVNIAWENLQNTFGSLTTDMWETSPQTLLDEEAFAAEELAADDPKRLAIVAALKTVLNVYVCQ